MDLAKNHFFAVWSHNTGKWANLCPNFAGSKSPTKKQTISPPWHKDRRHSRRYNPNTQSKFRFSWQMRVLFGFLLENPHPLFGFSRLATWCLSCFRPGKSKSPVWIFHVINSSPGQLASLRLSCFQPGKSTSPVWIFHVINRLTCLFPTWKIHITSLDFPGHQSRFLSCTQPGKSK